MIRAFQWDLGRQVERLSWLKAQLPRYADWGYNELYLHLEDAVEYPSLRGVARADAYTQRELGSLVEAAGRAGIGVVPIVNLLGHTQYLIKVPGLRDLNELRAADGSPLPAGQICPSHPRTTEVAYRLIHDVAPFCTAGCVHVGLDESFHLGKHPLSRADVRHNGLAGHFAGYVNRLHAIADHFALHLSYWADMLYFLPDAIPLLPPGSSAYDWYYYSFPRHPRVELLNFAERDLAAPLAAHGISYWGCPMNSGFRHEPMPVFGDRLANIGSWWRRCRETHAEGMLITSWETSRIAAGLPVVIDAAAASLWIDGGTLSPRAMLTRGFQRAHPRLGRTDASRAAQAALSADGIAHAGYSKWELDTGWSSASLQRGTPAGRPGASSRRIRRPVSLSSSLDLTCYFSVRESFVASACAGTFELRRAAAKPARFAAIHKRLLRDAAAFRPEIAAAERAADAMWRASRLHLSANPNRTRLAADRNRLHEWIIWLARCECRPASAFTASPVCGAWQLSFTVENFAPAQQKVVVEVPDQRGGWRPIHARFVMEFRAAGAEPRAKVRRETRVALSGPKVEFRIAVRGAGQVRIGDLRLTDGVTTVRPWKSWRTLGLPAATTGFPVLA